MDRPPSLSKFFDIPQRTVVTRRSLVSPSLTLALVLHGMLLSTSPAQLDINGNGLGDLWATLYAAEGLSPQADHDKDGLTNIQESIAGTNPFSPLSNLNLSVPTTLSITWQSVSGKSYQPTISSDLVTWSKAGPPFTGNGARLTLGIAPTSNRRFWRIEVSDLDADQDGLTAYEESLLGYSDNNTNSSNSSNGNDFASALNLFGSPGTFTFQGQTRSGTPPTLAQASRFLQQATMGADYETIQSVASTGFASWLNTQFTLPATSHRQRNTALTTGPVNELLSEYIWTWWDVNLNASDLLRQRVAFALSEIFVVSQTTGILEDQHAGVATFYDLLVNHAFGNFRDLLMEITLSPAMGFYLSHVKNRPTDLTNNIFPDENFAREIMQLFSIGLFELNLDGTRKKDSNGNDIPTYNNTDITNFAKVFTGLTYNPEDPNDTPPVVAGQVITSLQAYLAAEPEGVGMRNQMFAYQPMHEPGVKNLLNNTNTNGTIQQDLDAAIDNLFNHPNTAPFISRLLIQRLVKSTPSPAYIARVATAFNNNGSNTRGDMKAVLRAILLDPEARNGSSLSDSTHGKLREPVVRHLHLARAFNISSSNGTFRNVPLAAIESYNQQAMLSPSVFNFYLPDHQPNGSLKDGDLFAPEFQITTATTTIKTINFWQQSIPSDSLLTLLEEFGPPPTLTMDYSDEIALANDPDALLNRLDILLTRGQMTPAARTIIRNALVSANNANVTPGEIVRFAVTLIAASPDFAILR
ncbi:MAG: DUF1800 family protein [Verrucomicrobiota bacterium]